jgi:hypothetical protein
MFLGEFIEKTRHTRTSKLGITHEYFRSRTYVKLRCDNCDTEFVRPRGSMDPKRLSNNYFHVCKTCDSKKFAQRRGVERRKVWNLTASSDIPISKL